MTAPHLLVPIDFSTYADQALDDAIVLGNPLQAHLTLIHVIHLTRLTMGDMFTSCPGLFLEQVETEAQQRMRVSLGRLRDAGLAGEAMIVRGIPCQTIIDTAKVKGVDLIMMGTHGRTGLRHAFMGSVAEKVVRLAPCPVFVARQHQAVSRPHFLVPLDFSADSEEALTEAMRLAQARQARLTLLHVLDHSPMGTREVPVTDSSAQEALHVVDQSMTRYLTRVQDAGLKGDIAMVRGHPLQDILDVAHTQHVDLIVMGTHGRTGLKRLWLGSVAETVVRLAPCPVLVTHRQDHTSA